MIQELFEQLNSAMSASVGLALLAAFVWGVLSILLSPCHLASIPLVVGFVNGQGKVTVGRAFALASLFSVGILITIAALGAVTAAAGRIAGDVGGWAYYAVAIIFFLVGLHLLDAIPMPFSGPASVSVKRKGLPAALLLGLIFGIALGPCTFAYMAPVLGVTFRVGGEQPAFAGSLLLLYGIGHCSIIVAAGSASGWVQRYLDWNEHSGAVAWLRRVCGVLVILGGLWLIYTAP
ncbi:MAG: cytochrome c biogenesis CcdA family protein [Phycisphaeraceae bacterium]